jgi:hypothetical protein
LSMPVGDLVSNGAYMVMASLAWSLKAWATLLLPEEGRWAAKYREEKRSLLPMEFSTFWVAMIQIPCQIVRTSRRIISRLPSWNPWQGVFPRLVERLQGRRLCRGASGVEPGSGCPGAVRIDCEPKRGGDLMSEGVRGDENRVQMTRLGAGASSARVFRSRGIQITLRLFQDY